MKVLVWACGLQKRFAGPYLYREAKRQGFNVMLTGSRANPEEMLSALESYRPDWVFCFALRPNFRRYYRRIRESGARLLFWYPDMTERTRDRMWRRRLADQADVLVFSILETARRYRDLAPTVLWMPQYFDHRSCMRDAALPTRLDSSKKIYDLCFMGSTDRIRRKWLDELDRRYKCRFVLDRIGRFGEIRERDMAEVYAQSKVAFNVQRSLFLNPGSFVTSNRAYNAMGSGAAFVNHRVQDLDYLWKENVHCAMHDDTFDNLVRKIDFYLERDGVREEMAVHGQRNVLRYHTLEQRVTEYWQVMETIHRFNCLPRLINQNHSGYGMWTLIHE
jgi:hypothetical protein